MPLITNRITYIALGCLGVLMVVFAAILGFLYLTKPAPLVFTPYFTYGENVLDGMPRAQVADMVSLEEFVKWDTQIEALVAEEKLSLAETARLYTYIATAEHDAVMLAVRARDTRFTIAPLVKGVVCEFLPDQCSRLVVPNDPYSVALAERVLAQVHIRVTLDAGGVHQYPVIAYQSYWDNSKTYSDASAGSWKPWRINSAEALREPAPPAPDTEEGHAQVVSLTEILAHLSPADRSDALMYTVSGGNVVSINLLHSLSDIQGGANRDVVRSAHERMLLMQGIADALIVAYDTKYTYWYPRPNTIDPMIQNNVPTPDGPGYPAASVAAETVGLTLMRSWYPERQAELDAYATQHANASIYAGVHFQNDVAAAVSIGKHVADIFPREEPVQDSSVSGR